MFRQGLSAQGMNVGPRGQDQRAQQKAAPGGRSESENLKGRVKVMWRNWCFRCDPPRPVASAYVGTDENEAFLGLMKESETPRVQPSCVCVYVRV